MKHIHPPSPAGMPKRGAGCMILSRKSGRFLLCLRPESVPSGGTWAIWGGKAEAGESAEAAARREVEEETGYRHSGALTHLHHMEGGNFSYDTFLMDVGAEFEPKPSPEWERFVWAAPGGFPEPMHWGLRDLLSDGTATRAMSKEVWRLAGVACDFPERA